MTNLNGNDLDRIEILFLSSDPSDEARLRLGQEFRDIQTSLKMAKYRDRFNIQYCPSVRIRDLTQVLLDAQPQIVHFSGHGWKTGELCLESDDGTVQPLQPGFLADVFKLFTSHTRCVILNACYSESQANAISEHIPFVIGMKKSVGDRSAIAFSQGFYKALGANKEIETAYEFGCVEMRPYALEDYLTPVLLKKPNPQLFKKFEDQKVDSLDLENLLNSITLESLGELSHEPKGLIHENNSTAEANDLDSNTSKHLKVGITNWNCVHTLTDHVDTVRAVTFSDDGNILASGSTDGTIKIWDSSNGNLAFNLHGESGEIYTIAISPNSKLLASGDTESFIKVWDLTSQKFLYSIPESRYHPDSKGLRTLTSVIFTPDGRFLISGSTDGKIRLWSLENRALIQTVIAHSGTVKAVAVSPDGKLFASGSSDKKVKIWKLNAEKALRTFQHSDIISSIAFSPDGKFIASGSYDHLIKIWQLDSKEASQTLAGHSDVVCSVAFSPNGKILISGGSDRRVKVWSLSTGRVLRNLEGHSGCVNSASISPDGSTIASGSDDRTVRIWKRLFKQDFGRKLPGFEIQNYSSISSKLAQSDAEFDRVLEMIDRELKIYLKGFQKSILKGAWQSKTYILISGETNLSADYLKKIAQNLWLQLSVALREKVTKETFRAVIERHLGDLK